nr:hypothetical protein HmN_000873000 [Hymenolepis microstoma]
MDGRSVLFPLTMSIASMCVDLISSVISRNAWFCASVLTAISGGMGVKVSKYYSFVLDIKSTEVESILEYPEFSVFESSCLVTSHHRSTEGSAEVMVWSDTDDFS